MQKNTKLRRQLLQKYNRPPTAVEFLVLEDEIIEVADMIYKHLYLKKKGRRSA